MSEKIVKPLEWKTTGGLEWAGNPPLRYHIYDLPWGFVTKLGDMEIPFGDNVKLTIGAAKAAAQADYEARILSALSPSLASLQEENEDLKARIAALTAALKFYADAWCFTTNPKRAGLEWKPKESLLDDCGNIARAALQGGQGNG